LSNVVTVILVILIIVLLFLNLTRSDETGVTIGRYSAYNILTESMAQSVIPDERGIHPGDMIVVRRAEKADIEVGDVITFRVGGHLVTHRVVEVRDGGNQFITRGDANRADDQRPDDLNPNRRSPALRYDDVVGVVLFTVPYVGNLVRVLTQPSVWIFVPIVFVAIIISLEIIKSFSKKTTSKKAGVDSRQAMEDDLIHGHESFSLFDVDENS
jgi:signal peptidase